MSEFSDSYHLRSSDQAEGVSLLQRAAIRGYVFLPSNGWVTILAEGKPFQPNKALIRANSGLMLHFMHGGDHGWEFGIYDHESLVCAHACDWGGETLGLKNENLDIHRLTILISEISGETRKLSEEEIRSLFYPEDIEEIMDEGSPAYEFVELLGLENFSWTSFEYMDSEYDPCKEVYKGIELVE